MVDQRIDQLTGLGATPASGDLVEIQDTSDTTDRAEGTSKKVTIAELLGSIVAPSYMKRGSTSNQLVSSTPATVPFASSLEDESGSDISYTGGQFVANDTGLYRFGGVITYSSTLARAQVVVEVYVNGVASGIQRGAGYVRNSGVSYDFWALEISSEPMSLTAGDTVEFYVGQVSGTTYGYGGSIVIRLTANKSMAWFERIG